MKHLIAIFALLTLAACGPSFTSSPFTDVSEGGGIGTGLAGEAPMSSAGSSGGAGSPAIASAGGGAGGSVASAAGAPSLGVAGGASSGAGGSGGVASAGAGGSASAGAAGAASGGVAGAPVYVAPPCSGPTDVSGGYDGSLSAAPACLRTKESLNTITCANWDGRSIEVNGMAATCGTPAHFPPAIDGYNYIVLGAGQNAAPAFRWFLTAPAEDACSAREWELGDAYAPGEIQRGVCDLPGAASACVAGKQYAFSCTGALCASVEPGGGSGWESTWGIVTGC